MIWIKPVNETKVALTLLQGEYFDINSSSHVLCFTLRKYFTAT